MLLGDTPLLLQILVQPDGYSTILAPGTYAKASSTHADATNGVVWVNFNPDNSVDRNETTKWNDNTNGVFPDSLLIIPSESLNLSGIILVSAQDGWITDFGVRVSDDSSMRNNMIDVLIIANKTGLSDIRTTFDFPETMPCALLQIDVFAVSTDDYSRIHEVYPIHAVSSSSTTTSSATSTTTSSATVSPTHASAVPASPTPTSNSDSGGGGGTNTGAIAGGVVGGVGALVIIILAFWLVR